jgi:hypothetical protein
MGRTRGLRVPNGPVSDEYANPLELTDELLDKCIEIYLNTGNFAAVGRSVGRPRLWASKLFKSPRCVERMKSTVLSLRENTKIASIEECMEKLSSIMRGSQIKELEGDLSKIIQKGGSPAEIADQVAKISKSMNQIENNQIKATTILLTAQGAMDPNRTGNEDQQEVIDQIVLELAKSEGSVDAILDGIKKASKIKVIDVTPGTNEEPA